MKSTTTLAALVALFLFGGAHGLAATVAAPGRGIVLFPFDDHSLPLQKGLVLTLQAGRKYARLDPEHPNRPVLGIGQPGDPDFPRAYFSGTILEVDGEYRMWYTGYDEQGRRQVCYATSKDAINWVKPKLGLVEYKGSRENNLLVIDGDRTLQAAICLVIDDKEDPDPSRRFKMLREDAVPGVSWKIFAAVSPDGLRWTSAAGNKPVNVSQLEPSGFIRHNGVYYVNGHSNAIRHPLPGAHKRTMQTFVSYDFEHWSSAAHLSFRRDNLPPRLPTDFEGHNGPQVHLGAALWDRGNVVIGFYGMYNNTTNDRRTSTCDIGFIVSNDAIAFHEPLPEFKIVPSLEEIDRAEPRLTQGEAFLNVGDRTLFYYGIWTEMNRNGPTGVRVATWPRDRLGSFSPMHGISDGHCISMPLELPRPDAKVYVNADGMAEDGRIVVEILDEQMRPLPGFAAADFIPFGGKSGFRMPARWRGGDSLMGLKQPVRVRVNFLGRGAEDTRLYAIYVE